MQETKRYFRIGLLAVISLIVLVGALFFLGLAEEFEERLHFVTSFRESVQGLTKGAAVKFKGVPIGSVEKITILPKDQIIRVDMLIDPSVFAGFAQQKSSDAAHKQLNEFYERAKKDGLCCFLELSGITGLRYIEMDFKTPDQQRKEKLPEIREPGVYYFPSAPNTFNSIVEAISKSLDKIARIDIDRITGELVSNLTALNKILSDPSLKNTIDRMNGISMNVENITKSFSEHLTPEELENLLNGVNTNLQNLSTLTNEVKIKLNAVNTERLNKRLDDILASGNQLVRDIKDDSADVMQFVQELNRTVQNINDLVNDLKQDPSSVIRGKKAAPVELK